MLPKAVWQVVRDLYEEVHPLSFDSFLINFHDNFKFEQTL
jgi:hypothetical protein